MRVSDYIAQALVDRGLRQVFMMTGGGAMHLNDALGRHPGLAVMCNHHEQACAMAAEGYARVTGRPAVVNVTTGPGGINALNGVFGAFTDSIPMLVLSGQVKRETCMASHPELKLRQLGDQEVDIVRMASGITKYAALVRDPARIRYELEKALHLTSDGRPGPTWLDIPIDVQSAQIEPEQLEGYTSPERSAAASTLLDEQCAELVTRLRAAQRPVVLVGSGVRAAGAVPAYERLMRRLGIPVVASWTGVDLIASDDPLYAGRAGTIGDRAGNFAVQNADLLLVLGSRLPIRQVSYNFQAFARAAFKVCVDVDEAELNKPYLRLDLGIASDLNTFFAALEARLDGYQPLHRGWLDWCKQRVQRYPVVQPRQTAPAALLNPYHVCSELFARFTADEVIVCGNATASIVPMQVATIQRGQRIFANAGDASMGYDLPAAIGAAVARGGDERVICFAGDGSLQLNLQELQTVVHYRLPLKLFVLDNAGYVSMRQSQRAFFDRMVGEGPATGVSFPDMLKIASAYGLPAVRVRGPDFMTQVEPLLAAPGPALFVVMLDPEHVFEPKTSSRKLPDGRMVSAPLEDLAPFLDREELAANMLIPLLSE